MNKTTRLRDNIDTEYSIPVKMTFKAENVNLSMLADAIDWWCGDDSLSPDVAFDSDFKEILGRACLQHPRKDRDEMMKVIKILCDEVVLHDDVFKLDCVLVTKNVTAALSAIELFSAAAKDDFIRVVNVYSDIGAWVYVLDTTWRVYTLNQLYNFYVSNGPDEGAVK